jgi:hypothetical protein
MYERILHYWMFYTAMFTGILHCYSGVSDISAIAPLSIIIILVSIAAWGGVVKALRF